MLSVEGQYLLPVASEIMKFDLISPLIGDFMISKSKRFAPPGDTDPLFLTHRLVKMENIFQRAICTKRKPFFLWWWGKTMPSTSKWFLF
jgi:hypothetical protein